MMTGALNLERVSSCPGCLSPTSRALGLPLMPICQEFPAGTIRISGTELDQRKLLQCDRCGLRYFEKVPSLSSLIALYETDSVTERWSGLDRSQNQLQNLLAAGVIASMETPLAVLDVGSHTGGFLDALPDNWRKSGVEVNPHACAFSREKLPDCDLRVGTVETAGFAPNSFDLITAWNLMEHLYKVREFIAIVYGLLKVGGYFVFETGNYRSVWACFAGLSWNYYSLLDHTVFYSSDNITALLKSSGLYVINVIRIAHFRKQERRSNYWRVRSNVQAILTAFYTVQGRYRDPHKALARGLRLRGTLPGTTFNDHMVVVSRKGDEE